MKNALIFLLCCCFCSCIVTEKMRTEICNNCAVKTEYRDSIREVECWDTVRLPPITGPVIYIQNPCDSVGNLIPVSVTKTKNGVKNSVWSTGNTLVVNCDTDSLKAYIKTLKEKYVSTKKNDAEVKYIPCKDERTRFDGFTYWWFWGSLAVIIGWLLLIGIRNYGRSILGR